MPTDDDLAATAAGALKRSFGAVLLLAPNDGAAVWVDARSQEITISREQPSGIEADCTLQGSHEALLRILTGSRAFESAFVAGRISAAGDMSVLARLEIERKIG